MAAARDAVERFGDRMAALALVRPKQPESLPVRITRRRIYVLPTGFGLFLGAMLVTMLVGGLNYNNNPALLLVFLFAYLNLSRWHVRYSHITVGWLAFLGSLVALALFDPAVASGIARISLVLIAFAGFTLIVYLSTHGFDRAVLLIPTWFLLVVWVIAAGMTVGGSVTNDIVGPALLGGLVLIVMLIGFTVMQHAFAGGVAIAIVSDIERRALALTGAGVQVGAGEETALGDQGLALGLGDPGQLAQGHLLLNAMEDDVAILYAEGL